MEQKLENIPECESEERSVFVLMGVGKSCGKEMMAFRGYNNREEIQGEILRIERERKIGFRGKRKFHLRKGQQVSGRQGCKAGQHFEGREKKR